MFADLLNSSYFALFLIVALGFMLGRIKIKGLSLDVSAVIFIALLFGHFGVIIPKELGNFGLVLFIFTIGIQAGPGFFDSFRSKGKTLIVITLLIICSAALTAVGLKYAFDIDTPSVVGLIAGALTSTPGLAVAIDSTHSPLASIAYGIAYPFGVIGVILFVKLLPRIMRIDLDKEARRLEKERRSQFPELTTCLFRVTNPAVFDRSLMQINARAMTGAVISRHKHNEQIAIPTAQTILHEGDYIQAVGSEEALNQLAVLVGQREEGELPLVDMQEIESLLLTKKDMINKQLGDLNLMKNFGCTVTRVRRSGIDLSPSPDLALKFGDKLMVVGEKDGIKGVARLLGNDNKQLSDTDFFPIALGIVLGVLFGKLNISFSDSLSFSPGLTGGILMVALFLSAIGKTGPILWSMSGPANQLLRQLGLLLFLAEVGTSAGTEPGSHIPGKRLALVRRRCRHHAGTHAGGRHRRTVRIQDKHSRPAGHHHRWHDQHARPCRRRLHDGQQHTERSLCHGISHCHGVPHSDNPGDILCSLLKYENLQPNRSYRPHERTGRGQCALPLHRRLRTRAVARRAPRPDKSRHLPFPIPEGRQRGGSCNSRPIRRSYSVGHHSPFPRRIQTFVRPREAKPAGRQQLPDKPHLPGARHHQSDNGRNIPSLRSLVQAVAERPFRLLLPRNLCPHREGQDKILPHERHHRRYPA